MILLDTSVVLEIIERKPGAALCIERLQVYGPDQVHISAITVFEVEVGCFDGSPNIRRRRAAWQQFHSLTVRELVFDDIASRAAEVVRKTAAKGQQLGAMDALIAATALEFDLTVATRDADFDRVAGLKVEHWR